jgi:DNA-binding LacI/PurR family transcriptional regulator
MREIAEAANVSVSTASLALNDKPRVSSDTRRRVMAIAASLGYKLESQASSTNFIQKRHVGIVYPKRVVVDGTITNLSKDWINGIRQALDGNIGNLTTFGGCDNVEHDLMFQHIVSEQQLHGAILIGVTPEDGYLNKILELGIPLVVLNRLPEKNEFSSVCIDNYGSGVTVANYLKKLGHKKVALIKENSELSFAIERNRGAETALKDNGMLSRAFEYEMADSNDDNYKAQLCREILESGVTAAYFTDDLLALRCIELFCGMGVDIPADVTIVGFNDCGLHTSNGIRCTSVDFNKIEMGRTAGEILLRLLEKGNEICNITTTFKTNVVAYDTSSPVRNNK